MEIIVRKAKLEDIDVLARNVVAMAYDARQVRLDPTIVHEGVKNLFSRPQLGHYLVAEVGGQVAGSLMLGYEWSDWRNGVYWWIESVYVHPDFRRQGVYRSMYQFLKSEAKRDKNVYGLNLSVYKHNAIARKSYEQLGMKESESIIYGSPEIG